MKVNTQGITRQHFTAVAGFAIILTAAAIGSIMLTHETNSTSGFLGETKSVIYTSASPILVSGNTQLAAASSSGNGSPGTPYIIENLAINASGTGSGIFIQNTNAHVIIRDCNVTGSEAGVYAGIKFQNVTNANVTRCNSSYNGGLGIYLYESSNCMLINNVLTNNTYGIYIYSNCENNTISGNTAAYNDQDGIYVDGFNNTVSGNTASFSNWNGIRFFGTNNTCSGNTVTHNNLDGIYFGGSNNTASANTATYNGHSGIYFGGSNNTASANTATYNTEHGIISNGYNYSVVSGNTASYNGKDGIYVDGSYNTISDNTASHNTYFMGIVLWAGNHNTIKGNTASYNQYGIYLHVATSANTVTNNVLHYNTQQCIQDDGSSNVVNNNDCLGNSEEIPGYETGLLCIASIATIAAIVATRKTRRS